jgi:hypothetical protein
MFPGSIRGGESFLRLLAGNSVTISGNLELDKDRPEIVIPSPTQIQKEINEPENNQNQRVHSGV